MGAVDSGARAMGVEVGLSIEKRMEGAAGVGGHKTSMLQDLEAGRPLEIEALLGAVVELARREGVAVPSLTALYGLTKLLDEASRSR